MQRRTKMINTIRAYGFDRILTNIQDAILRNDSHKVFRDLLLDYRGNRQGFPTPVYRALVGLYTEFCFEHNEIDEWANLFVDRSHTTIDLLK